MAGSRSEPMDTKDIMAQVRQELALQNFQEMLSKVIPKCFSKCVLKPGTKLDSSEQTCIVRCADSYQQAFGLVSRTYLARLQRESMTDA
ncbi:Tim10/DDP family zinc finger-domain-containing protein [Entophlyctis helioformis]|nr:Tim10/DDP family zinc finger-domain-containing protein [Entophlyctis helioformis]